MVDRNKGWYLPAPTMLYHQIGQSLCPVAPFDLLFWAALNSQGMGGLRLPTVIGTCTNVALTSVALPQLLPCTPEL